MKFTKAKAAAFYKSLIGSAAGMEENTNSALRSYRINAGQLRYETYLFNGVIVCQLTIGASVVATLNFDPETFERVNY